MHYESQYRYAGVSMRLRTWGYGLTGHSPPSSTDQARRFCTAVPLSIACASTALAQHPTPSPAADSA
eukprot:1224633-Rhodomonas_salina.2